MPSIFQSSAAGEILLERGREARGRGGEHRPHGWPTRSVNARSAATTSVGRLPSAAAPQRGLRDLGERSAQLMRPSDLRGRDAGRLGHRVGHDALERALPQVTGDQPDQELPLALRRAPDQPGEQRPAPGLRAGPGERADRLERGVGLGQRQRRLTRWRVCASSAPRPRRRGQAGVGRPRHPPCSGARAGPGRPGVGKAHQRRVTDPDLALRQVARQERDRDRHLVDRDPGQQVRDLVDLRLPA